MNVTRPTSRTGWPSDSSSTAATAAGGRLPDARLAHRGGGRRAGDLAAAAAAPTPAESSNLGGWLTTVVARVCLDMLRSRPTRREDSVGAHVPDPVRR